MISKLVLATHNLHKVQELRQMLQSYPLEILSMQDFPGIPEPEETGNSFYENASIKARAASIYTGLPALADDSGICVDALNGAPGIYSARWAGIGSEATQWIAKTLELLDGVSESNRSCRYICVLTLTDALGNVIASTEGVMEGRIAITPVGDGGFGYDPIFLVAPDYTITASQLTSVEKHAVSHRGIALRRMLETIQSSNLLA